jgi:hypothetical protein
MTFGTNTAERMRIDSSGRIGVGATNPGYTLDVRGSANVASLNITDTTHSTSTTTGALKVAGGLGVASNIHASNLFASDFVGIGTTNPSSNLHVNGNVYVSSNLEVGTANLFVDTQTGKVGVGTTAPQYKLDLTNAATGLDTPMNPSMDNDVILFDDGRSTTTFNGYVGGNATRDTTNQWIRLTPNALGQTGWVNWNLQLPNSWTCEFDMYRGSATAGADVIWFIFYGDVTSTGDPAGASNYYYFLFDEYLQDEIILGQTISGTSTDLVNVSTTYLSATWQKVVINYERGRVTASVDGATLIDHRFDDASIQYTGRQVAFRANSGSVATDHYVRKIKITKGSKWIYSDIDSTESISYMNGNVGIGTTSPQLKMDVYTDDTSTTQLYIRNDDTGGRSGLTIAGANGEGFNIQKIGLNGSNVAILENFSTTDSGIHFYTKGDGDYRFRTTDSNSTRFLITNDGDVAVGAITPQSKLHVDGDVRMKTLSTNAIGKITPVYARGTGQNNVANRLVKIGDTTHVNTTGRGLTLTIVNASTHAHVSSTNYDTYGSITASNNLATALEAMTDTQIGIITSYDAYEDAMTANLINACYKLGLTRLAASNDDLNRHPYAAIFYGPGASTVPGNHALEVMKSDDASGAYATLSTFLIDDSFIGQTLTNALYSGTGDSTAPTVIVDRNANVGIGTTNPLDKLMVMNGTIRSHDSGNTTNNPGLKIRRRPAAAGQSGSNYIECGQFNDVGNDSSGTDGNKFIVKNDGNVGIGTSNPTFKFDVVGGTARIRTTLTGGGFIELGGTETNPDTRTENVLYGATTYINLAGSTARYGRNVRFQPGQMYGGAMWATSGYGEPTLYGADNVIYGGDINASGNDGTGAGQYYAGNTYIGAGIAWAGNTVANSARTYNGSIYFQTGTDDTTSSTDTNRYTRMTIDRNGNVGIGIAAASDAPLHIYRNGFNPMVRLQNGSYNQYLKPVYNEFRIESAGDIGRYGNITFYTGRTNNTVQQSAYVGTGDSPHGPGLYGNSVVSTGNMIDSAFDFILGVGDQSSRGDTGISRALVKNSGEVLNINYADDFEGGVYIQGSVSKDSGSFKIDHPLPEMADTHHLVHSFIEGPQADNLYRGVAQLEEGVAVVNIDEASRMTEGTFVALNRRTQCFTTNETDWDQVRGTLNGNILTIECQNTSSTANVSWLVIGERQDKHMYETRWTDEEGRVITEPEKPFSVDENEFDHWIPKDPEAEEMNMEMEMARKEVIWPDMEDAVAEEN